MLIAVVGESNSSPERLQQAEEVGRELAKRGVALICGGLGGVMEAACRGAKGAGGQTIGIIPSDRGCGQEPNPYVDVPIYTGMGQARNIIIVKSALAVVAVGGKYGTLSEIAMALSHGIPVVGLGTWELGKEGVSDRSIHRAGTAIEAVEKALTLAEKARTV